MPISDQVMRDLREVASTFTRAARCAGVGIDPALADARLVFRVLPELLDEVELARREQAVVGDADRVQHLAQDSLQALRDTADGQRPDDVEVPAQQLLDVLDYVAHLQTARVGLRAALNRTNELLVERCSLHDTLLAKDFLAVYQAARSLSSGWIPAEHDARSNLDVEGLALQVTRLAPLYDDVRRNLALHQRDDVTTLTLPIGARLALVLRELAPHVGVPFCDVALLALLNGTDDLLDRFVADAAVIARLRADVQSSIDAVAYPIDPAHSVKVLQGDGSTRVECDHTFVGSSRCGHCGIPFAVLRRRQATEAASLQTVVQEQVEAAQRAGFLDPAALDALAKASTVTLLHPHSDVFDVRLPPPSRGIEQVEVVSVPLGPVLLRRVQALVDSGRLGRSLGTVAQTLFILGLLEVEGQDPRAHFGEPKQHISVDGAFLGFALPHEGPGREDILRSVFAWLQAWLGDEDPLAKAPAAALAALPK